MNNQILKTGLINIAKYLPYKTGYFYTSLEKKKKNYSRSNYTVAHPVMNRSRNEAFHRVPNTT